MAAESNKIIVHYNVHKVPWWRVAQVGNSTQSVRQQCRHLLTGQECLKRSASIKHRVHLPWLAMLAQKLVLKAGWMVPFSIPASMRSCFRVCAYLQCRPRGQLPLSKKSLHQLVLKSSDRSPYTTAVKIIIRIWIINDIVCSTGPEGNCPCQRNHCTSLVWSCLAGVPTHTLAW